MKNKKTKKKEKEKEKKSNKEKSSNEEEEINEEKNDKEEIPNIQKVHIYNNNRHLQKSSSAGNFSLFFEPYYSELKNNTKNKLFRKKPIKKSIIEVEYIDLPAINNNLLQTKLAEKEKKDSERKALKLNRNRSTNNINLPYLYIQRDYY